MKGSKSKRILIILAAIVVAVIAAVIVFSLTKNKEATNTFVDSGYILISNPESNEKSVRFKAGEAWKYGAGSSIVFADIQKNKTTVDEKSFVHYTSNMLQALSNGVVVDLDALTDNQFTEHYAISNKIFMTPSGDGYQMTKTTFDSSMSNFIWKLNESKYMLVSDSISLHFADDDVRDVSEFVELSYIDNGVIQFQTEENFWQTVSADCYGVLSNGIIVDFSLKNIENKDGEVLMDFNKIVLDSESNVEVQPLSESLAALTDEGVPHFNVNAEDGQDGTSGTAGGSGGSGSTGSQGGSQGQGDDGIDGQDKSDGDDGVDGDDGKSPPQEGTVLHFPVFTLGVTSGSTNPAWEVGSTYCKGNVIVSDDKGMLVSKTDDGKGGKIILYDIEKSTEVNSYEKDFKGCAAEGYDFEFSNLEPDRAYRLVVEAPIKTSETSQAYIRTFISKAFYTNSNGAYFTVDGVTTTTASVTLHTESFSAAQEVYYQIFPTYTAAAEAKTDVGKWTQVEGVKPHVEDDYPLDEIQANPNQTQYLRGYVQINENNDPVKKLTDQILAITTLKERATVGSPLVTSNRYNWGFDITPGVVTDPNQGIVRYVYEFYYAANVIDGKPKANEQAVTSVEVYTADGFTVPLDGTILQAGYSYVVRCVAEFYDNEKTYNIESGFSNACTVIGSQLPSVYFTNNSGGTGPVTASTLSDNYDAIVGTIHVDQASTGARLVLKGLTNEDQNYHPYAIIRASGYYYVKYPIYPDDTPDESIPEEKGKYLKASEMNGNVSIEIPDTAFTDKEGGVDGLKGGIGYSIIIVGNLTENGTTYTDQGIKVGTCTVSTPKMQGVNVLWGPLNPKSQEQQLQEASFRFSIDNVDPDDVSIKTFNRMMRTLDTVEMKLFSGTPSSTTKIQIGKTVIITNDPNQQDTDPNDNINYLPYTAFLSAESEAKSFADAIIEGMHIKDEHFGLTGMLQNNVYIELTLAEDYTINPSKRANQTEYVAEPDDTTEPGHSYVYENIYSMVNTTCEIAVGNIPDPLPEDDVEKNSFDTCISDQYILWYDTDGDGDFSDKADMKAKYANSCKIATEITYYVFDAPDFYKVYDPGTYHVSEDFAHGKGSSLSPISVLTAVTAVQTIDDKEVGNWLGKTTIAIPKDGSIPTVSFIPQTAENYLNELYPGQSAVIEEKLQVYRETGTINGSYYMFYNDGSLEPKRGHQFVFAWTLKYVRNSETPEEVEYYPFDLAEYTARYEKYPEKYGENGYYSIPHCSPQDKPMKAPVIYSVPWSTDYSSITDAVATGSVTWKAGTYDPDNVIAYKSGSDAQLFRRDSGSKASKINGAAVKAGTTTDVLYKDAYTVTIPINDEPDTTITTALAVQRYTDVYTTAGRSKDPGASPYEHRLFYNKSLDYSYISGSSESIPLYSFSDCAAAFAADKYYTAFAHYIEPKTNLNIKTVSGVDWVSSADTLKVSVVGEFCKKDDETGKYYEDTPSIFTVTVTGNADDMKLVNGIRLKFTAPNGKTVTLDKYLDVSTDGYETITFEGNKATLAFDIFISRDLGNPLYDVTAQDNVQVTASALYESNSTGFSYVVKGTDKQYTFAYNRYELDYYTNNNLYIKSKGTWRFDSTKNLSYSKEGVVPYKMGSFFHIDSKLNPSSSSGDYTMTINSTRLWEWAGYSTTSGIGIAGAFRAAGVVSVPRVISEARALIEYTKYVSDPVTKERKEIKVTENPVEVLNMDIPIPKRDITYEKVEAYVNSLKFDYSTSKGDKTVYYTILKYDTKAGTYSLWQAHNSASHKWTTVNNGLSLVTAAYEGADSEKALKKALDTINTQGVLMSSFISETGKGTISVDDLDPNTQYQIIAWYWQYDGGTGKFTRYLDMSSGKDNHKEAKTLEVPFVTLEKSFVDTSYFQKSIRTKVTVEKVTKFYYTIELYKHNPDTDNDEFETFLYAGTSVNPQIFDVGMNESATGASYAYKTTVDNIKHNTDESIVFDTTGCERYYLDYNATVENNNYYVLRVRVYDLGSGPAWGEDTVQTDLLKANEDDPSKKAYYVKKLETPFSYSTYAVSGKIEIVAEGGDRYSQAKFTPSYIKKSNSFRNGQYTFVAIRKTTDDSGNSIYQNVTRFVKIKTGDGYKSYSEYNGLLSLTEGQKLYLDLNSTNFPQGLKKGDTFTLYPFAVQDIPATTCGYSDGISGDSFVDYILASRGIFTYSQNISTSDALTAEQVSKLTEIADRPDYDVDNDGIKRYTLINSVSTLSGYSKIMIVNPYTVTYNGEQVNAGTITVTPVYDAKTPRVNIQFSGPVGFDSIRIAEVSITGQYSYTDSSSQTVRGDESVYYKDENFKDNRVLFTYLVTPQFTVDQTKQDFKWLNYTVTLKFKAYDEKLGVYYYVTMKVADGDDAYVSKDGLTYTKLIPFE